MMEENRDELSFHLDPNNSSRFEARDDFNKLIEKMHQGYLENKQAKNTQDMKDRNKPVYYRADIVPQNPNNIKGHL